MEESEKKGWRSQIRGEKRGRRRERREVRPVLELGEYHENQTLHWTIQNDCA